MPPDPDEPNPTECPADDAMAVLRHDLKTPLTAISGQMQLARRRVRRMDGPERDYLLARLAAIEDAVLAMGDRIERLGRDPLLRGGDPPKGDRDGP